MHKLGSQTNRLNSNQLVINYFIFSSILFKASLFNRIKVFIACDHEHYEWIKIFLRCDPGWKKKRIKIIKRRK